MNYRNKLFYSYKLYSKSYTIYIYIYIYIYIASIYFQAPTWTFCEAPTSRAPTLSCQGTNLVFRSTNSKDTNPSNFEGPTPRAPTLSFQGIFWLYYTPLRIFFTVFCQSNATSMKTRLCMKESSQLIILPTQSLQGYLMMISNTHHDLQQCF